MKQIDSAISLLIQLHNEGISASEIAHDLNGAGYVSFQHLPYTTAIVRNILKREAKGCPGRYSIAFKRAAESNA